MSVSIQKDNVKLGNIASAVYANVVYDIETAPIDYYEFFKTVFEKQRKEAFKLSNSIYNKH